jgi:hypothetical protein
MLARSINRRRFLRTAGGLLVPAITAGSLAQLPVIPGGPLLNTRSSLFNGLVAYWILDEHSGTRADQLGVNPLTDLNSNVSFANGSGVLGNTGATFAPLNITKSLQAATAATFSTGSFTMSGWLDWTDTSFGTCISKHVPGNNDEWLLWNPPSSTLNLIGYEAATTARTLVCTGLNSGVWKYITFGFDATNQLLFFRVNAGTNQTAACASLVASGTKLTFGNYSAGTQQGNQSTFQDWGFWSRVLTLAEIQRLYNSGSGLAYSSF